MTLVDQSYFLIVLANNLAINRAVLIIKVIIVDKTLINSFLTFYLDYAVLNIFYLVFFIVTGFKYLIYNIFVI